MTHSPKNHEPWALRWLNGVFGPASLGQKNTLLGEGRPAQQTDLSFLQDTGARTPGQVGGTGMSFGEFLKRHVLNR